MIYALVGDHDPNAAVRTDIASAIENNVPAVIQHHVDQGTIVHILDVPLGTYRSCIYCPGIVRATPDRHSRFFKHTETIRNDCLGHAGYLGIENPRGHGCDFQAGQNDTFCHRQAYCHRGN